MEGLSAVALTLSLETGETGWRQDEGMTPNPLRLCFVGYALALALGVGTGLAGWQLLFAFWLGGPVVVLGLAALPVVGLGLADDALAGSAQGRDGAAPQGHDPVSMQDGSDPGERDADLAEWDADLAVERANAALQDPAAGAGEGDAADTASRDPSAPPRSAAG